MDGAKKQNYEAIADMARTEGWKIIEDMLVYDVKFATSLLTTPKMNSGDPEWIVNEHEIGRARGVVATAAKYLNKIKNARERVNRQ